MRRSSASDRRRPESAADRGGERSLGPRSMASETLGSQPSSVRGASGEWEAMWQQRHELGRTVSGSPEMRGGEVVGRERASTAGKRPSTSMRNTGERKAAVLRCPARGKTSMRRRIEARVAPATPRACPGEGWPHDQQAAGRESRRMSSTLRRGRRGSLPSRRRSRSDPVCAPKVRRKAGCGADGGTVPS